MVNIGTSDKVTNLWPVPSGRPVEKLAHKDEANKDQQQKKKRKNKVEDGPGKNIDEYA